MARYRRKSAQRTWTRCESREMGPSPDQQRLTDLSLALIIPWKDGFPQYWLNEQNEQMRMGEILIATDDERLPWEL
jgi:hypothetical protein